MVTFHNQHEFTMMIIGSMSAICRCDHLNRRTSCEMCPHMSHMICPLPLHSARLGSSESEITTHSSCHESWPKIPLRSRSHLFLNCSNGCNPSVRMGCVCTYESALSHHPRTRPMPREWRLKATPANVSSARSGETNDGPSSERSQHIKQKARYACMYGWNGWMYVGVQALGGPSYRCKP